MILLAMAVLAALPAAPVAVGAAPSPVIAIPPASLDDSLEVLGEGLEAKQLRSRMSIAVQVNGKGPFRFVVDSGADRSVVGAGLAAALALPPGGSVMVLGMAGRSRVDTVKVDSLTIGPSTITGIVVPTFSEANLGAQGLLGIDALADQRLMLDFDRRTITIQDTRQKLPFDPDEIVVTARRRKGQLILTRGERGIRPDLRGHRYRGRGVGRQPRTPSTCLRTRACTGSGADRTG